MQPISNMNPITSLRKLGIRLVGDNGLLTTTASKVVGLGPLERAKMLTEARQQGLKEAQSMQQIDKGAQDLELGGLKISEQGISNESAGLKLAQDKELNPTTIARAQAEAESVKLRNTRTGQEIKDAEDLDLAEQNTVDHIAQVRGITTQKAKKVYDSMVQLNKMGAMEITEPTAGLKPGIYDDKIVNLRQVEEAARRSEAIARRTAATEAARIAAGDRTVARDIWSKAVSLADKTKKDVNYKEDSVVLQRAKQVYTLWDALAKAREEAISTGKNPSNNPATIAILTDFNKILDAQSVVRESEYARAFLGTSLPTQIESFIQRLTQGGPLALSEVGQYVEAVKYLENNARQRRAAAEAQYKTQLYTIPNIDEAGVNKFVNAFFPESTNAKPVNPLVQAALTKLKGGN